MKNMKMVDAIREALREELARDENVFLIGEAIGGSQGGVQGGFAGQVMAVVQDDRHVGVVVTHFGTLRAQQFDDGRASARLRRAAGTTSHDPVHAIGGNAARETAELSAGFPLYPGLAY